MTCNKFTQDNNLIKEIPLPDLIVNYAYQRKPDSRMVDFIKNKKDFCLSASLISCFIEIITIMLLME